MRGLRTLIAAVGFAALAGTAHAALVYRGGGMIYDTTLNVTWLADMNNAATSGYSAANVGGTGSHNVVADGRMGWDAAMTWANGLVYGGFDDWRLPTLNPFDTTCSWSFDPGGAFPTQYYGHDCTGGELSHLFVSDLGIKPNESVHNQTGDTPEQIANLALFLNAHSNDHWSGTAYAPDANEAWLFYSSDFGIQSFNGKHLSAYAMAVRTGDVVASVPEPKSLALTLLALALAVAVRRRVPVPLRL